MYRAPCCRYHKQREQAATPMKADERKVAQQRLYAAPPKQQKGAVYA